MVRQCGEGALDPLSFGCHDGNISVNLNMAQGQDKVSVDGIELVFDEVSEVENHNRRRLGMDMRRVAVVTGMTMENLANRSLQEVGKVERVYTVWTGLDFTIQ